LYTYTPKRQSHCLWCLKPLQTYDFSFLIRHDYLCNDHEHIFKSKLKKAIVQNQKVHYFLPYTPEVAALLFRYKEHADVPLCGCIFYPFRNQLKKILKDNIVVIVPSSEIKTKERGFHPLKLALEIVGVKPYEILIKASSEDQKKKRKKERKNTQFLIEESISLPTKKVILFDDVLTSGHSLLTCKQLLENRGYQVNLCVFAIHTSWLEGI
jgi:competence protein ComFC